MRKFIQKYHKSGEGGGEGGGGEGMTVPLDILMEVDKITFMIEDDWFEVKMRANYVVRDSHNF